MRAVIAATAVAVSLTGCGESHEGFDAQAACRYLSRHTMTSSPVGAEPTPRQANRLVKFYGGVAAATARRARLGHTRDQLLASARSAGSRSWASVAEWQRRPEQVALATTCRPLVTRSDLRPGP